MAGNSRAQNNNTRHLIHPRIGAVLRFARTSTGFCHMCLKKARLLKEVSTELRSSVNSEFNTELHQGNRLWTNNEERWPH